MGVNPYALHTSNPSTYHMLIFKCLHLNQNHHLLLGIPSWNNVNLVYVSSTTFILNCWRLMDSPHSCIANVHVITAKPSSFVSTPLGPIFLDLIFPHRWSKRELIGMFHDLLALLKECVPLSTTSMVVFNVSSIHMPLLVVEGIQFIYGDDLLLCGSKTRGRFFLFDARFVACYPTC